MTRDHYRMLKATIEVLRSQRAYVKRDERYREAYRAGVRKAQEEHEVPLAIAVRPGIRKLEWEALKGAYLLARYYPRGLLLLVDRRPMLERQLRDCDKQVREKERRFKELRSALQMERRALRRLRERNRPLERSKQELKRQLEEIEASRSWRLLKRIRRS